jgi:hypothetical protein
MTKPEKSPATPQNSVVSDRDAIVTKIRNLCQAKGIWRLYHEVHPYYTDPADDRNYKFYTDEEKSTACRFCLFTDTGDRKWECVIDLEREGVVTLSTLFKEMTVQLDIDDRLENFRQVSEGKIIWEKRFIRDRYSDDPNSYFCIDYTFFITDQADETLLQTGKQNGIGVLVDIAQRQVRQAMELNEVLKLYKPNHIDWEVFWQKAKQVLT